MRETICWGVNNVTKDQRVKCKHCDYDRFPNQTQMSGHVQEHRCREGEAQLSYDPIEVVDPGPQEPAKAASSLSSFLDGKDSPAEQEAAEMAQVWRCLFYF